ncbi:uncharacterized protein EV422DRAFT_231573 [Fimicolochytrium jonesii]|uniref:uncharacterized protein n=1 Tax=Fimicolochytrium jonesii TaxID=1396493 RepID=UPI0022FDF01B|nr:uncharacterized protein EV422DRAFT_231573 [Fimicolochytrium jonesii]KAI8817304.1 hypothetical protein EV422DRAFT_231573 [Fimicolochytrium jonesii]
MSDDDQVPVDASNLLTGTRSRSAKHNYEDATVLVIVEDKEFAVHKSLLKRYSMYFETLFAGPWRETNPVRGTNDSKLVSATCPIEVQLRGLKKDEFDIFLDLIYDFDVDSKLSWLEISQIVSLLSACEYLLAEKFSEVGQQALRKLGINWDNICDYLGALKNAHSENIPSLKAVQVRCVAFLKRAGPANRVHVLYIAEQYGISELLSDDYQHQWPRKLRTDEHFEMLSFELRYRLLYNQVFENPCCFS